MIEVWSHQTFELKEELRISESDARMSAENPTTTHDAILSIVINRIHVTY